MKTKVLIGISLSIIVAVLLFTVLYDTPSERLEARKAICEKFNNEGKPEIGEIFYGAEPGLGLAGNYTVKELYKLAEILEDKLVEEGELSRSIYRKWRKGTDCETLFSAHGIGHPGALLGHTSKEMLRALEARLDRTDIEPWMVGTWRGCSYQMDWNNEEVCVYCNLTIYESGYANECMKIEGCSNDVKEFSLEYDRRNQQLYYYDDDLRIYYKVNPSAKTISSGHMVLYKDNCIN